MFKSLLVANRGEIAVRVIRACRELGIRSVAICSDVDRESLHTRLADRVVPLGGRTARDSYLDVDRVVHAAQTAGAEDAHPGYGFLSYLEGFQRAYRSGRRSRAPASARASCSWGLLPTPSTRWARRPPRAPSRPRSVCR